MGHLVLTFLCYGILIGAGLLVLFLIGKRFGYRKSDPYELPNDWPFPPTTGMA
jgi:hypothetical protein